jgi:hypothetical protein
VVSDTSWPTAFKFATEGTVKVVGSTGTREWDGRGDIADARLRAREQTCRSGQSVVSCIETQTLENLLYHELKFLVCAGLDASNYHSRREPISRYTVA